MKKRFAVTLCLALALVTVAGCGAKETPQAETEQKATEATVAEVKEEPTEEIKEEPVTEEVKEEPTEEIKEEEPTPTEETETEETGPAEEPAPIYLIDKYVEDGDFSDFEAYGTEMGTSYTAISKSEWNIKFAFDGYFVTVATNLQDPKYSYIGIGVDKEPTFATLINYLDVPSVTVSASGAYIPDSAPHVLEDTINYMKEHPDATAKPDMYGLEWTAWNDITWE